MSTPITDEKPETQPKRKRGRPKGRRQRPATTEEIAEREAAGRTQGRAGCKLIRFSAAFSSENFQFIQIMSRINGMTMTSFLDLIVQRYREANSDVFKSARKIISTMEQRKEELADGQ